LSVGVKRGASISPTEDAELRRGGNRVGQVEGGGGGTFHGWVRLEGEWLSHMRSSAVKGVGGYFH